MRRQLLSVGSLVLVIVFGAVPEKALASLGPLGPALVLPIDNQTPVTPVIVEGRTGDFEVAWLRTGPTALELAVQHLAADGTPTDVAVTATEGELDPEGTVAACLTGGEFVVAWVRVSYSYPAWPYLPTPSSSVVGARLLDSGGRPLGPELQLSAQSAFGDRVKIAALSTGGFVALWSSRDANGTSLLLRRFDSLGQQVGNDTVIPATGG